MLKADLALCFTRTSFGHVLPMLLATSRFLELQLDMGRCFGQCYTWNLYGIWMAPVQRLYNKKHCPHRTTMVACVPANAYASPRQKKRPFWRDLFWTPLKGGTFRTTFLAMWGTARAETSNKLSSLNCQAMDTIYIEKGCDRAQIGDRAVRLLEGICYQPK